MERYGEKPPCDGISIDDAGNVYVTDVENNAVGVTSPDGSYRVLASDDGHLSWPDGFSFGPDGHLYVAVSQLHRSAVFNAGRRHRNRLRGSCSSAFLLPYSHECV
jgi:sugar lactone lactonase YvrE